MVKEKEKKLMVVDGNSLIHRGFHAIPHLSTSKGFPSNGVYGFVMIFLNAIKQVKPDYVAVAFDVAAPTFRHKMFSAYKAKRVKAPQELYDQIPKVKEFVKSLGLPVLEKQGYEADDVIGTITKHKEQGVKTVIVTGDLDALQLVDKKTSVLTTKKGLTETLEYDEQEVTKRYGFGPEHVVDYKALRGDPSDNIPGVLGIGEKTACDLIKKFGSIEDLYEEIDNNSEKAKKLPDKLRQKLIDYKQDAFLSKKLAVIDVESSINFELEKARFGNYNAETALKFLQEMEFKSLSDKLPRPKGDKKEEAEKGDISKNYYLVKSQTELDKLVTELKKQKGFAVDTETTSQKEIEAELLGIAVCYKKGSASYIPVLKQGILNGPNLDITGLKKVLADKKIEKYGHNLKYDYAVLNLAGIELAPLSFDTMIAAYLLNPGARGLSLDNLAFTHFGYQMQPIEDLIGKGKKQITLADVPLEKVAQYSCEDVDFTFQLKEKLEPEIKKEKLTKIFDEIDMPLVPVLALMEKAGVKLDTGQLNRFSKTIGKNLFELEKKIHKLGDGDFNIASPKQLKDILFTKLQISTVDIKKTKTGLSTAASELEKMKDKHPIIPLILQYRELSKLKNTYLDALPKMVSKKTNRLHTSFNQTITATGRLSSNDPNLQNIPIRTELGNKIREGFVAENGYELLSLDYSQIELRVVAHLSGDKVMRKIFKEGKDIHTATAAEVFEKKESEVTPADRRNAKIINFGVLYGLSAYGLTQQVTALTREQAQNFIDKYFFTYRFVDRYLKDLLIQGKRDGFVQNPLGRKRYLPELSSSQFQVRAAAERAAINMPVQSLASDVIKVAMIDIAKKIGVENPECKMLLQVHDELVFEVRSAKVKEYAGKIKKLMEQSIELSVPVKVEAKIGKSWGKMAGLEI